MMRNRIPLLLATLAGLAACSGPDQTANEQVDAGVITIIVKEHGDPAPRVERLAPAAGPKTGGTVLVLEGLGFRDGVKVKFGTLWATVGFLDTNTLVVTAPAGEVGRVDVEVTNPDGGTSVVKGAFEYREPGAASAPKLLTISPTSGPAQGGTFAELAAEGLQPGVIVFVGGRPAPGVNVLDPTFATVVLPGGAPGPVDVAVTNPDGQSALLPAAFTRAASIAAPPPLLTGVLPSSVPVTGEVRVKVTGDRFARGVKVYVGGIPAPTLTQNETLLEVNVPPGRAGLAQVAVTNPDGQSSVRDGLLSYYQGAPSVFAAIPELGPQAGGTEFRLAGAGFNGETKVLFGTLPAARITYEDPRTLRVVTPPMDASGRVDITVRNADGQEDTAARAFFFYPPDYDPTGGTGSELLPPTIDRLLPTSGAAAGGTLVLVSGTNFVDGTEVLFGNDPGTNVRVLSARSLSVRSPAHGAGPVAVEVRTPRGDKAKLPFAFHFYDEASTSPAPALNGIFPSAGPTAGGTLGMLSGRNLSSNVRIFFGDIEAATVRFYDATRLAFVTPPMPAGVVDVVAVNPDGKTARLVQGFGFYAGEGEGPAVTSLDPESATAGRPVRVKVNGARFAPGVQVLLGETPIEDITVRNSGEMSVLLPGLAPGVYSLTITTPDGRTTTAADVFRFVTPVPKITRVVPAVASTVGGTKVLIQGEAYLEGARVIFGDVPSTEVVYIDENSLLATSPAHTAAQVDVTVVNPGGAEATKADAFEYRAGYVAQPPPVLEALLPATGPASGGTVMQVKGAGFQDGLIVLFGSQPARRVLVTDDGGAVITAPAGPVGLADVTVVNPDGQVGGLSGAFRYVDANTLAAGPVLTGVIPDHGPETRPTDLLLTGRRLGQGAMVFVGRFAAPFARRDSDTLIASRAPIGQVGAVDVAVTNPDGQSSQLENGFTYRASPKVTSVTPAESPDAGGRQLQVFGEFFEPSSRLFFGSTPAGTVSYVGPTLLVVTTPAHTAGVTDITVTNSDGQEGSLLDAFTFRAPPQVQGVVPANGPVTGGSVVAISGKAFVEGAHVFVDGREVAAGWGDANTIVATMPVGAFAGQQVAVKVVNPDGQEHALPQAFRYLDPALFTTGDPTISSVKPGKGPTTGGTYAWIAGENFDNRAVAFVGNRAMTGLKIGLGTSITGFVPGGPIGKQRVAVTNPDGRSASLANAFEYVSAEGLAPAPTVASTTPQQGISRGGDTVSIGGTGFATTGGTPLVFLAGFPANEVNVIASTTLSVKSGPGVVGLGDTVVTNPDGQSAVLPRSFAYEATAPAFRATNPIVPASGPVVGGTNVTIYGNDFDFGCEVRFGTNQATGVTLVSPTELRVRAPPGPIDVVDVTVTNPGGKFGTATKAYTYIPPPLILTVTPASGPQAGNTAIVINGRYFRNEPDPLQVRIGSAAATTVKMESNTVVTAVVPAGTGTAAVTIINGDGQRTDLGNGYVYLPNIQPPTIVAVSPDAGDAEGNTYVTIVGAGFSAGAKVFFVATGGDFECTDVRVMSPGALTCRTPAGTANTRVAITVKNPPFPGGTEATLPGAYSYRPGRDPGVLSLNNVTPQQGPCAGGTEVIVGGQGIKNGAKVYLDGIEQDDVRVYGPTAVAFKTRAYGTPANCPRTPVTVRVQNPTLEFAELTGTQRFEYAGGNRRFVYADGDRTVPESYDGKTNTYGNIPIVGRFTGSTGGGRDLSDILIARTGGWNASLTTTPVTYIYDTGGYLYETPSFRGTRGIFWQMSNDNLYRWRDCGGTNKVQPVFQQGCTPSTPAYQQGTAYTVYDPVFADFDLNQWPDVLYYDPSQGELAILYNDAGKLTRYGLGGITGICSPVAGSVPSQCPTGSWNAHAVANVDLDSAGKLDIIVATSGIDVVLRNETTPTVDGRKGWVAWAPRGPNSLLRYQGNVIPTGDDSRGVGARDIDGDGDVDLVFGGYNTPLKTYLSNLNQLSGSLAQRQAAFTLIDVAGAPYGSGTAFQSTTRSVELDDLDKDGDPDLLVTNERAQDEIWMNDGVGHFTNSTLALGVCGTGRRLPAVTNAAAYRTQAIDLDADSDLDLVQWLDQCCTVTRPLRVYRNTAQTNDPTKAGCFVEATNDFFPPDDVLGRPELQRDIGFGDLDGDGFPDAVYAGANNQQARVYFNVLEGGKRVFRDQTRVRTPNRWDRYTMGGRLLDADGDGDRDLFVSTSESGITGGWNTLSASDSRLRLYLNDGAGYFTDASGTNLPQGWPNLLSSRIPAGDMDGDGDTDLVLPDFSTDYNPTNGQITRYSQVRLWLNDGHGKYTDATYPRLPVGDASSQLNSRSIELTDLDGDNDLDVLVGTAAPCLRVWQNIGNGYFTDITSTAMPNQTPSCRGWSYNNGSSEGWMTRDLVVADFDYNGTKDLFISHERGVDTLLLNCPDAAGNPIYYSQIGLVPCSAPNAPFLPTGASAFAFGIPRNDAGTMVTDLLRYQNGVRLWRSSRVAPGRLADETTAFIPANLPGTTDQSTSGLLLAPLDYDGDGDKDFVYSTNPGQGPNKLLRQGAGFTDVASEPLGLDPFPYRAGDETRGAVGGDVNGDGFDDVVMFNQYAIRVLISAP